MDDLWVGEPPQEGLLALLVSLSDFLGEGDALLLLLILEGERPGQGRSHLEEAGEASSLAYHGEGGNCEPG